MNGGGGIRIHSALLVRFEKTEIKGGNTDVMHPKKVSVLVHLIHLILLLKYRIRGVLSLLQIQEVQ